MIKEPNSLPENTQTLFRFQTVRAPQKILKETMEEHFIQMPNIQQSSLYATTKTELEENLNSYNELNMSSIVSSNLDIYKLGESILQSRSYIEFADFQTKISQISTTIDNLILSQIWDEFSYQALTGSNVENRELASILIYINHIHTNSNKIAELYTNPEKEANDNIVFRSFLDARIVIPREFISPENNPIIINNSSSNSNNYNSFPNYEGRKQEQDISNAHKIISNCNELISLLEKSEVEYNKEEDIRKSEYKTTVENTINSAYNDFTSNHPELLKRDPDLTEVPFFTPPVISSDPFDYIQFKSDKINEYVIGESKDFFDLLGLETSMNFSELNEKVLNSRREAYAEIAKNTPTEREVIVVDGYPIPGIEDSLIAGNTIAACCGNAAFGNNINFEVYLKFSSSSEYPETVKYRFDEGDSYSNAEFSSSPINITMNNLMPPKLGDSYSIEIEVTTNLGNVYHKTLTVSYQTCSIDYPMDLIDTGDTESSGNMIKGITRVGIIDYRKVEQYICCYVPGEVSHIENIMAREYKSRTTRRLRRTEDTFTSTTESEREKLTDTSSTEKNEMQEEMSKLMKESKDLQLNAGISWEGPVKGFVNGSFAYHNSKEESNKLARNTAKELTMKATERLLEKTRDERIQKIVEEFSDENQHGVDNRQGDKHISGVYRWVDKIYKNVIHNYGKRLIYEFMIPEPASFHAFSLIKKLKNFDSITEPLKPSLSKATDLNESNYVDFTSSFNVEADPYPSNKVVVSKSYSGTGGHASTKANFNDLNVPEGYVLTKILVNYFSYSSGNPNQNSIVHVGGHQFKYDKANSNAGIFTERTVITKEITESKAINKDTIPVSMTGWDVGSFALNVTCEFTRTDAHYKVWQNKLYTQIMTSYNERYRTYEEKLKDLQAQKAAQEGELNPQTNSMYYREIEQTVLRKNCIAYLLENKFTRNSFVTGSTLSSHNVLQNQELEEYASKVKFLEQAFEWEIMGYQFYPYYWAPRDKWTELYARETTDKLFTKFLQSGMARVFLTVRPGFEEVVNWYITTGQIWMGSQPPVVGDELFLSIVDELKQPESIVEGEWESRVPSTLTVIQSDSIALDTSGLPCMDTCTEHQSQGFETDTTTLKDLVVKVD